MLSDITARSIPLAWIIFLYAYESMERDEYISDRNRMSDWWMMSCLSAMIDVSLGKRVKKNLNFSGS